MTEPSRADEAPACPICSRQMQYCDPSHELAYWACPATHQPRGVVHRADKIDSSFALVRTRILDAFDQRKVDVFAGVTAPEDVSRLATDLTLAYLKSCLDFKRMRQRKRHDDLPEQRPLETDQSGLGDFARVADGGSQERDPSE